MKLIGRFSKAHSLISINKGIHIELIYFATFFVACISSILSGIAGGGGSFIMAPYWLIAGLSPVQGATTGAFMAIGMGGSSLAAFKGTDYMPHRSKLLFWLITITLLSSLIGPFFLPHISIAVFKPALALLTIISIPFLFVNRRSVTISGHHHIVGYAVLALLFLMSSFITSSIFSIFISIVLTQIFRFTILQSTAIRRLTGLIQSALIFTVLIFFGGFVWQHALAALLGGSTGSFIGTKFSIKRGEHFAKLALSVSGVISAVLLIF